MLLTASLLLTPNERHSSLELPIKPKADMLLAELCSEDLGVDEEIELMKSLHDAQGITRQAWFDQLSWCSVEAIAQLVQWLDDDGLLAARVVLARLAGEMHREYVQDALLDVLEREIKEVTIWLGHMILPCWPEPFVRRILSDLREMGAHDELVHYMRERQHPVTFRLIALEEIEQIGGAVQKEALAWRLVEWFDEPEFVKQLKAARKG